MRRRAAPSSRKGLTPLVWCSGNRGGVQDVLVSPSRFAKLKDRLLPDLRARGDAAPRQMRPGTGHHDEWLGNLSRLRDASGGTLVRGFCLYELPCVHGRRHMPAWRCCFHAVIETRAAPASGSGRALYSDPNEARRVGDDGAQYIFVPSSRAHADLDDEQVLSGDWILGSVLLGDAAFCGAVLAHEQTRGRRPSVVALSVDGLVAKRNVLVRLMPHFLEWARLRGVAEHPETIGELMGMEVHDHGVEMDEFDTQSSYQAVVSNPESYVSGIAGLRLELQCREQLLEGKIALDEVRALMFAYFDETYNAMRKAQLDACTRRAAGALLRPIGP